MNNLLLFRYLLLNNNKLFEILLQKKILHLLNKQLDLVKYICMMEKLY